jgi:ureidoacrylate peracid hydrolase
MTTEGFDTKTTALLICDLQNDFIDPRGAYGQSAPEIAALPAKVKLIADALRSVGGLVIATQFTLVPGRDGEPLISAHLRQLRPFLTMGDFAPGSWGNATVDLLQPVDVAIEKVAYSAFYMSRLEWVIRKLGIKRLLVCGIVTNGGVTSTVRDAHVRDIDVVVIEDGCAAFAPANHKTAIDGLRNLGRVTTVAEILAEIVAK